MSCGAAVSEGYVPFGEFETYWRVVGDVHSGKSPLLLLHGGPGSTHNYFEVLDCLAQTGVDGAAIARGAQGNPWIFRRLRAMTSAASETKVDGLCSAMDEPVSFEERIRVARVHVERLAEVDEHEVVKMRTYFAPYFKGMPSASRYRGEVMSCRTLEDFEQFFDRMWDEARNYGDASELAKAGV